MLKEHLQPIKEKIYEKSTIKKIFKLTDDEFKKALDYIEENILFEFDNIEDYKEELLQDAEILYALISSLIEDGHTLTK